MKTALTLAIEDTEKALKITISDEDKSVWLEKEKQQIDASFCKGFEKATIKHNQTFNTKEGK